jgi:hypothetical protein
MSTAFVVISALLASQATAFPLTCNGTLIDVWTNPKAMWPLAMIWDNKANSVCLIDRERAGHVPPLLAKILEPAYRCPEFDGEPWSLFR